MGGAFRLVVDGDLFKVTLAFPEIVRTGKVNKISHTIKKNLGRFCSLKRLKKKVGYDTLFTI